MKTLYQCIRKLPDGYVGNGDESQVVLSGPAGRSVITHVMPSGDYEIETAFPNRTIRLYYGNPTPQAAIDQVIALNTDELISLGKLPASARGNRESTLLATEARRRSTLLRIAGKAAVLSITTFLTGRRATADDRD